MPVTDFQLSLATWSIDPVIVAAGAASATSTLLPVGVYYLNADTDIHFKQGAVGVTAATTSSFLPKGAVVEIEVKDGTLDAYVAVIRHASTSGSSYLNRPAAGV